MEVRPCIRTLIKLEAFLLYVVLWICLMTVHFQSIFIPKHYLDQKHQMEIKTLESTDQRNSTNHDNERTKNSSYTGLSNTEFMGWFINQPKFIPLSGQHRKHPHLVSYDVQKEVCHRGSVHLLIYIHSAPENVDKRNDIRNTWGGVHNFKSLYVERVFLIGETTDKHLTEAVERERKDNDDIIRCHFIDTVRNLSLKALALLDFVNNRCQQAKYILKVDDDIFVNIYSLIEKFIPQIMKKPKSVVCQGKYKHKLVSDRNSKWYIPPEMLLDSDKGILPTFCSGYLVLFSSDLVPLLLNASYTSPLVPVDDVYLFGFLLKAVGTSVNFVDGSESFTLNQEQGMSEYQDKKRPLEHCVVTAPDKGMHEILWGNTLDKITPFGKEIMNQKLLPFEY
ncbi:beta-1,3-galactosyltransferase 1-like [Argopecten irradians]|uniref:beta-1,3-galactosyltransferase 1-like n=1 Tax=Argopecten irradians TaxID=31199 RepID=UPI00371A4AE1